MIRLKNIWNGYRQIITRNCTNDLLAETSLQFWQNRLFAATVIYTIPLSIIALVPGIYMAYITGLPAMIAVDSLAMITILSVAFMPGISVFNRKILFNGVLYITSTTLLIYLGSFGPGLLYLLGITIFIVLSLDRIYGYAALVLNTLICVLVGCFLYFGIEHFEILNEYGLDSWIAVSSNLVFLSAVAVFLIPILFEGLQSAIIQENNLRTELEKQHAALEETNAQLYDKNQELEQFSYTISHDLKEPLRMIRSFMELLDKRYREKLDEKAKKYIHFAVDGAQRMAASIDDLLEFSRVGRLYTEIIEINPNSIIDDVLQVLSAEIEDKNATIDVSDFPPIKAVPITFKMLMQNLISNALKYQPDKNKPVIALNYKDKDTHWEFSISDNGIGIPPEYFDEIFGIFKRLHTPDSYPGTGMGLAISKKIVEQLGGEIWVESASGKGSTFYFTIQKFNGNIGRREQHLNKDL